MFSAETDRSLGLPVVHELYPEGEAGIQKSIAVICTKIREGMVTAVMKSFAGNVLRQTGTLQSGTRDRASALCHYVATTTGYAPDALGSEQIQSAAITLCVEGAPICIPIRDCFPEGTLLLREDGQLVPIEEIREGDRIWGKDKWTTVQKKWFKGKLEVDAIEMNNGSTMYLTPDHKVYVGKCKHDRTGECPTCHGADRDAHGYERIRVGDLTEQTVLLRPERIAFGAQSPNPGRMYIEGLALADGWAQPSEFRIAGRDGMRKESQKREVQEICARLGIETHWHRRYITVKDSAWADRIASLGSRARFKRAETLDLNEVAAQELLRGLMADSTANTLGGGRTYSTTSHTMMVQVRVLHRMFGRSTSVRMLTPEQHKGAGKHPLWRVCIPGEESTRQPKPLMVRSIERAVSKVPCWDITTEDHYVYLPEHDVTVSNCDDGCVAVGTLCGAAGMDVRVVRQMFGAGHQQHVLLEVKLEDGTWYPLDPSNKAQPYGVKAPAQRETRHSPFDAKLTGLADQAQFVGMGALPVWVWQGDRWHQIPANTNLDTGLGAIWPGLAQFQAQTDWLGKIWSTVDPKGRDWDTALSDAYRRAESKNWVAGDEVSRWDLIAIILRSMFLSRAAKDMPEPGPDAARALDSTWLFIATKLGYSSATTLDDLRAAAKRRNDTAALALFELIIIVVAIAAQAVVICFAIYYAAKIVDSLLARLVAFANEVWHNVQIQKIIDRHLSDPNLPWSDEEKNYLHQLEQAQEESRKAATRPPGEGEPASFWSSPWALFGTAAVLGGTVLAVVYRKEIVSAARVGARYARMRRGRSAALVAPST